MLFVWLDGWTVGLLVGRLVDWLFGCLVIWWLGVVVVLLFDCLVDSLFVCLVVWSCWLFGSL